jgi:hypothetical protein
MLSGYGISFEGYAPAASNRFAIVPSDKFGTNLFLVTLSAIVAKRPA